MMTFLSGLFLGLIVGFCIGVAGDNGLKAAAVKSGKFMQNGKLYKVEEVKGE